MMVVGGKTAPQQVALSALAVTTLLGARPGLGQEPQDSVQPPWVGAWHWLDETQDGRLLLTKNWFCGVFGAKDRPSPVGEQPTVAESAALFRSMSGPMCGPLNVSTGTEQESVLETTIEISAHPARGGARTQRPRRVEGDRMYGDVLASDGTVRDTWSYERLSDVGSSPLAGAWELVSDEWEGIMLMTDTEYRYVVARKDRAPIQTRSSQLTDADAAALYHSYDAQGGSYGVSGSIMTRRPAVARDPRGQGREIAVDFTVEGESLTIGRGSQQRLWRKID